MSVRGTISRQDDHELARTPIRAFDSPGIRDAFHSAMATQASPHRLTIRWAGVVIEVFCVRRSRELVAPENFRVLPEIFRVPERSRCDFSWLVVARTVLNGTPCVRSSR